MFGEVWAWIDVFMLVSYQYSVFSWQITKIYNLTKKHITIMLNEYETPWTHYIFNEKLTEKIDDICNVFFGLNDVTTDDEEW